MPVVGVWLGSLAMAGTASAATVEEFFEPVLCGGEKYGQTCPPARGVAYRADPGEVNRLSYTADAAGVTFKDDAAPLKAGAGCAAREDGAVRCEGALAAGLRVQTGDGADAVRAEPGVAVRAQIDAGPGDDVVTAGAADDEISGGGGRDELYGGVGDDVLADGDGATGDADVLDGGPDQAPREGFDRGAGDVLSYEDHSAGVQVDLRSPQGPDGDALGGFEAVRGGPGDDRLTGLATGDPSNRPVGSVPTLDGGPGDDVLSGGGAADWLDGDEGSDTLSGGGGDDELTGGDGEDRLSGGADGDRLFGQAGSDRFSGGSGDDHLDTNDGNREVARCGAGKDTVGGVYVEEFNDDETLIGPDSADRLARDCEWVPTGDSYSFSRLGSISVQPLRVGARTIRLSNACRPCARGSVRLRVGGRTIATGRLRGRRTLDLRWRSRTPRGRTIDVRVSWQLVAKGSEPSESLPYAYTIRLRIPR